MAKRLNYEVLLLSATLSLLLATTAPAAPLPGQIQPPTFKYWTWRNPLPHGDVLKDVTFGGGIFLAVGGRLQSSVDGRAWVEETAELTDLLNAVTYGDGLFVAVGEGGQALTSPNGASWTRATTGTAARLNGVAHGQGWFIAVGDAGTLLASTDGQTWERRTSGTQKPLSSIAYGAGQFVAAGDGGVIIVSQDGVTWEPKPSGTTLNLSDVAFGNGLFVVVGPDEPARRNILTSPDATTWTKQDSGTESWLAGITSGDGLFVAVGWDGIRTSPDGVSWSKAPAGSAFSLFSVHRGNGAFVAVGASGQVFASPDGASWTAETSSLTESLLNDVLFADGRFLIAGADPNTFLASTDGANWAGAAGVGDWAEGVAFGNVTFVAVGREGKIQTSADGQQWTPRTSGTSARLRSVAFGNGTFVAAGEMGTVLTSPDATVWTQQPLPTLRNITAVAFLNGRFFAVDEGAAILVSGDGAAWDVTRTTVQTGLNGITAGPDGYVAVGGRGTIVSSADAITWTRQNSGIVNSLNDAAFAEGVFVAVGDRGTVLTSPDGSAWTPQNSHTQNDLAAVAFGNGVFTAIGDRGTILTSLARPPARYRWAAAAALTSEDAGTVELTVERIPAESEASTVEFVAADGGARAGTDYVAASGTVRFAQNQGTQTVVVGLVQDATFEPPEDFSVLLRKPSSGWALDEPSRVSVSIADADDGDRDSLPDAWEKSFFTDVERFDGAADPDRDGNDNLTEYRDGTDPTSASSAKYSVQVQVYGAGAVTFTPALARYDRDALVNLQAVPTAGDLFSEWSGAAAGSANPLGLRVTTNRSVIAIFAAPLPPLADWLDAKHLFDNSTRAATRDFFQRFYPPSAGVPMVWTGSYQTGDAGRTAQAFRDAVLLRVNFYRALAGIPANVTEDLDYSRKCQQAALMMSVNRQVTHSPDSSWLFYTAAGAEAAGKSDLILGGAGPEAIDLYVGDTGSNNAEVGHRNWILDPPRADMGTGDVPGGSGYARANALWVVGRTVSNPATRTRFVAWPPSGHVPYPVVAARWSFKYPGGTLASASVSMRRGGQSVAVQMENVPTDTWHPLVWIPTGAGVANDATPWPRPEQDEVFTVTVHNVRVGGESRDVTYEIIVFDPATAQGEDHPDLKIQVTALAEGIRVSWPTLTGFVYHLEQTGDLRAWTNTASFSGTGNPVSYVVPTAPTPVFVRLRFAPE